MSQAEILKFLTRKKKGCRWWSVADIKQELKEEGWSGGKLRGVSNDLFRLASFGLIKWKGVGVWSHKKVFKGK